MAADALAILVWSSLTFSAAVLVVLALRGLARRLFGARVAYGLWLIPPLACLGWLAPARRLETAWSPAAAEAAAEVSAVALAPSLLTPGPIMAAWIAGTLLGLAVFAVRQWRFLRAVGPLSPTGRHGGAVFVSRARVGPAVVGVLKPAIVLPCDFDQRFSPRERALVLAHERAHLAHGDPAINAAVALARCLNWFNPLAHIAADALRVDQELACDARVLDAHGEGRRCYAEAMLKSHHAAFAPPLGCAWPDRGFHPLKERIAMLKQAAPSRLRRRLGSSAVTLTAIGVGALVWGLRPAEVVAAPGPLATPASAASPSVAPRVVPAPIDQRVALEPVALRPVAPRVVVASADPTPSLVQTADAAPALAGLEALTALQALPATGVQVEPEAPAPTTRAPTVIAHPVSGRHKCPAARALIPTLLRADGGVRSLGALACIGQITAEAERAAARREGPIPPT